MSGFYADAGRRAFVAAGVAVGNVLVFGSWLLPGAAQAMAAGAGVVVLAGTWVRSRTWKVAAR